MLPSSQDLLYFLEVCQTHNLSRASERLGISQPSLSTAIKRLEHNIGTPLFIRTKNGVQLTKSGQQFSTQAKQLLHLWDTLKSESLASLDAVQGQFTLGCHPSVAQYALPSLLAQLLNQHPKLEIQLKHDLSRKIVEGIINFNIDIGIVVNPIKHRDLVLQKLYDDKVSFWTQKNNPQSFDNPSLTIICDPDLSQTQALLQNLASIGIKQPRLLLSSNLDVIASLTANGAGIGILPRCAALANHADKLITVADAPIFDDEIYLAYRSEQRQVKALQVLIQTIKQQFKDLALYTKT